MQSGERRSRVQHVRHHTLLPKWAKRAASPLALMTSSSTCGAMREITRSRSVMPPSATNAFSCPPMRRDRPPAMMAPRTRMITHGHVGIDAGCGGSQTVMASPAMHLALAFNPGRDAALVHGGGNDLDLRFGMVLRHHIRDLAAGEIFHVHHDRGAGRKLQPGGRREQRQIGQCPRSPYLPPTTPAFNLRNAQRLCHLLQLLVGHDGHLPDIADVGVALVLLDRAHIRLARQSGMAIPLDPGKAQQDLSGVALCFSSPASAIRTDNKFRTRPRNGAFGQERQRWRLPRDFATIASAMIDNPAEWRRVISTLRGLLCPLPVLKARKRLESMPSGHVLKVVATDPMSAIDMPHFCSRAGSHPSHKCKAGRRLHLQDQAQMTYDFGSLNNWGTLKKVALRTPAVAFQAMPRSMPNGRKLNYHSRPRPRQGPAGIRCG